MWTYTQLPSELFLRNKGSREWQRVTSSFLRSHVKWGCVDAPRFVCSGTFSESLLGSGQSFPHIRGKWVSKTISRFPFRSDNQHTIRISRGSIKWNPRLNWNQVKLGIFWNNNKEKTNLSSKYSFLCFINLSLKIKDFFYYSENFIHACNVFWLYSPSVPPLTPPRWTTHSSSPPNFLCSLFICPVDSN